MLVVTSRGGDYSSEPMRSFDFLEPYLRALFGFVGITDIRFFNAQAMDLSPEPRRAGQKATIEAVREYARSGTWRPEAVTEPASAAPPLVA